MDYLNPRGNPFTAEDLSILIKGLSRIAVEPDYFQGEEKLIAQGVQSIQKRVEESIALYESRVGTSLSSEKRAILKQSLMVKILQKQGAPEGSSLSHFLARSQKSFEELLKLSHKRGFPQGGGSE